MYQTLIKILSIRYATASNLVTARIFWTDCLTYLGFGMDSIKRLFKRLLLFFQERTKQLSRYIAAQTPEALESSPLGMLPTEILQQVARHLPTISAASFSLSCRYIYFSIGNQHLKNLATSHQETLVFLNLLEQDLQNQIVCYPCRKLHKIKDARKYTQNGQHNAREEPYCLSKDRRMRVTFYIHDDFSTTVFKMAIKHHRHFGYNTQSRQLLKLLSYEHSGTWGSAWVTNKKAECQIKRNSLLTCVHIAFHGTCTGAR